MQTDRIYARPNFVLHYRAGRRLRWSSEGVADYAALLPLAGAVRWREGEGAPAPLAPGGALLSAPGDLLSATSEGPAEWLVLTHAPVFILDAAVRARIMRDGAAVRFGSPAAEGDERLARLARDLAEELRAAEAGQELVVAALIEQTLVHLLRR